MKKALLFAILALSINAFAQIKRPTPDTQYRLSDSKENFKRRMEDGGWKTSGRYSGRSLGQAIKYQTLKQLSLIPIIDSAYRWEWDTISIGWKIKSKFINIVYDAYNNLISYTGQSWNGSIWENSLQSTSTYDASNNQTSELGQYWNGSAWENSAQYTYTYDANNNPASYIGQSWNGSAWENYFQYIWTYDANNNRASELGQNWNGTAWENSSQITYTYNANNNQTGYLSQFWTGSEWWDVSQGTNTYDANNNLTIELEKSWSGIDWENYWLYTYTYDANNNRTKELQQSWNGSTWENYSQDIYSYDANNFMMSDSYKYWNYNGTEISSGDSTYYYFHGGGTGINVMIVGGITVYPNPSRGKITISSNSSVSSIEIYNLLGERIYTNLKCKQQTSREIDLTNFPEGIYFVKIYNGMKSHSKKIVIL